MPVFSTPRTPEGRLIRAARRKARLSIDAAAKIAGISAEHWGNIERGRRTLTAGEQEDVTGTDEMIADMARAAGVPADRLAADDEDGGKRPGAARLLGKADGPRDLSEEEEHAAVVDAVRRLYPGDRVAESIVTQWHKPREQVQRELDNWRASQSGAAQA
jgi:transcriptional regulator with XRE-family HTH domain